MSAVVLEFPRFSPYGPKRVQERQRLAKLFAGKSKADMRRFWDEVSDHDIFYHGPEGDFDCADIHAYLNMLGDGQYCAV